MKRISMLRTGIAVLLCLISLLGIALANAEGEVTVKNYKELVHAVNELKANRILISAKYKHGTSEAINLEVEGQDITIAPENGEKGIINGRVDIYGEGTVAFDKVVILASQDTTGLWVGKGASVTIDSVSGGEGKKGNGAPAAIVDEASLTVGSAIGGNANNGKAGDGIIAVNGANVDAREVTGGNCPNGVGGAGVVAMSGAKVAVAEKATGGNGAVSAGKAVLAGLDGEITVSGPQQDGEILESKKAPDPGKINSYALLENALRNGQTEIQLDPGYKSGRTSADFDVPLFTFGEAAVHISGTVKNGKNQKIKENFIISGGSWDISGLDMVNSFAQGAVLGVNGHAELRFSGNIESSAKKSMALGVRADAIVSFDGNITVKGTSNAVNLSGGQAIIKGNLSGYSNGNFPVIYATGGQLELEGDVISQSANALFTHGDPSIRIRGSVTQKSNKEWGILIDGGEVDIEGEITTAYPISWYINSGKLIVNGVIQY